MVGQIAKTGVCRCVAHCDPSYLQHQLLQTCGLLSSHYCGSLGWQIHELCGCYEALKNVISPDHQVCCVEVLLIATDEHIQIPVDIRSAFDCVRRIKQEPSVSVMWQV